ncbi:MAG: rane protein [Bacteroidota bacterium]|jgi:uncharacterized membrane protein|nr:rane protein [Bacteroidota bacterium]
MNKFLKYFLQGLALFIPIGITVIVFFEIFQFFEGLFSFVAVTTSPALNTVISVVCLIIVITIFGLLASSYIFKKLFEYFESKMENIPVVRHIYSPIKDFMNAFMGNKRRFTKPVLVLTNPQANVQEIGFITQDDLSEWGIKEKYAVYLPYSYSFSGRLIIVPKEQITYLNTDGADAMKFLISGGVTDVD